MVKCACGKPDCKISLYSEDSKHLWIVGKSGEETLMYLNEDTLGALVTMLLSAIVPEDSSETGIES